MSFTETTRYQAVIEGRITDFITGEGIREVTVSAKSGGRSRETTTSSDGFYFFMDLADGNYALSVEATQFGTRYGTAEVPAVTVQKDVQGRPVFDARANVQLQPTRLSGTVTKSSDGQVIAGAVIQVVGSEDKAVSGQDGKYMIHALLEGAPNIRASANGYLAATRNVALAAGADTTADFSLVPA